MKMKKNREKRKERGFFWKYERKLERREMD